MTVRELRDLRAPAFPDEPYSAYCKVCWQNIYALWMDKRDHHKGACPFGHTQMLNCNQAMEWDRTMSRIRKYISDNPSPEAKD